MILLCEAGFRCLQDLAVQVTCVFGYCDQSFMTFPSAELDNLVPFSHIDLARSAVLFRSLSRSASDLSDIGVAFRLIESMWSSVFACILSRSAGILSDDGVFLFIRISLDSSVWLVLEDRTFRSGLRFLIRANSLMRPSGSSSRCSATLPPM